MLCQVGSAFILHQTLMLLYQGRLNVITSSRSSHDVMMSHNQVSPAEVGNNEAMTDLFPPPDPYPAPKPSVFNPRSPGRPSKPTSITRCRSEEIPFHLPTYPSLTPTSCPCCPAPTAAATSLSNLYSQLSPGAFSKLFSDNLSSCSSVYSPTRRGVKNGACGQKEIEVRK